MVRVNCKFILKRPHSRNFCNPLLRATPFTHHTNDVQNDFAVSGYRNLQSAVNRKARNDLFHYADVRDDAEVGQSPLFLRLSRVNFVEFKLQQCTYFLKLKKVHAFC